MSAVTILGISQIFTISCLWFAVVLILKRINELGAYLVRQNKINESLLEIQEVNNRMLELSDDRIRKLESLI